MLIDEQMVLNKSVVKSLSNLDIESLLSVNDIYKDYYLGLVKLQWEHLTLLLESGISE